MTESLFTRLEQEWAYLVRSREMAAALAEWAAADDALRFSSIADLEATATNWDGSHTHDAVISALLARGSRDERAARAVLQFILPVLKAMVRRYSFAFDSVEDCTQDVVAAAVERIALYPWHRWPSWRTFVVRNLTRDIRQAVCRHQATTGVDDGANVDWDELEESVAPPTERYGADRLRELIAHAVARGEITGVQADAVLRGAVDGRSSRRRGAEAALRRGEALRELVADAVARGDITAAHADVVVRTRVEGATLAELASSAGCSVQAIHRRRVRAERAMGLDAA